MVSAWSIFEDWSISSSAKAVVCSNWHTVEGHIGLGSVYHSFKTWNFVTDIFKAMLLIFKDLTDIVSDH